MNPTYADFRYPSGREATVSNRDLAPAVPQTNNNITDARSESFIGNDVANESV